MKKLSLIIVLVITGTFLSCDVESTGNVSRLTVFPELTVNGESLVLSEVGVTFNDPGATASAGGTPIDFETTSDLDINTPGFYTISYSAENEDGFVAAATRTVIVYENNGTIAGVYDGIRISRDAGGPILISSRTDGDFNISDLMGGYYEYGVGYGNAYAFPAVISIDESGTITSENGGVGGFGPCALSAGSASADRSVLTWTATLTDYAFGFDVQMTKITP